MPDNFDVADPDPIYPDYKTPLSSQQESDFQKWVLANRVPFDDSATSDYDMRGFWKAAQEGDPEAKTAVSQFDNRIHYTDTYKTPFHRTFSAESQYATSDAPDWVGDRLIDKAGNVVADETPKTPTSWDHFPVAPTGGPLEMATIPQKPLKPISLNFKPAPAPAPSPEPTEPITPQTPTSWDHFPVASPAPALEIPTPTPESPSSAVLDTVRAMSFGPGNYPGADKPTSAVMYGALTDAQGHGVKMTTSDVAISPNLLEKHGLKLGDYVDVLDHNGNVVYAHQRLADKSYVSRDKPTTDSIELWGRPDIGYAQIRRSY